MFITHVQRHTVDSVYGEGRCSDPLGPPQGKGNAQLARWMGSVLPLEPFVWEQPSLFIDKQEKGSVAG